MIKTYAPIMLFVRRENPKPLLRRKMHSLNSSKRVSTMRKRQHQQRSMPFQDSSKRVYRHTLISLLVRRAVKALKRAESFLKYLIRMYQRLLKISVLSAQVRKANHATMRVSSSTESSRAL